ncbi:MAG: substrate-binding domain-containing protein [Bryobacteraceae bacterium]|jgi:molybdate-binding protein/DNA-binding XRE family transcriptional regulator
MQDNRNIANHLTAHRQRRGFSAADLARRAGISRQTIYAIESGSYIPNTAVALRLARTLEVRVEDLFALPTDAPVVPLPTEKVTLLPQSDGARAGDPMQLCRVDRRTLAVPPSPVPWYLPTADAVLVGDAGDVPPAGKTLKATVQLFHHEYDLANRILVAGCDPGISVLARHLLRAGVELVAAHRNSTEALALLKQGVVHVAGTHLRSEDGGESNLPAIHDLFARNSVAVVSLAIWEEGLVVARGNPKSIRAVADFARPDVSIVNREPGAGSRKLLDAYLARLGIAAGKVSGYDRLAAGHLPASWQVRTGNADCCMATRAAARVFGLDFIALETRRYDLAIRRPHLDHPPVAALLDTLNRAAFRRELEGLGGYDTREAGRRML